jgi:hypothetical protein
VPKYHIRRKIARELSRKFQGAATPELLSRLNSVNPRLAVPYAYLFRELPFEWEFDRMKGYLRFDGRVVESFGISRFMRNNRNQAQKGNQVLIHDYRSNDDFIVELKTRSTAYLRQQIVEVPVQSHCETGRLHAL